MGGEIEIQVENGDILEGCVTWSVNRHCDAAMQDLGFGLLLLLYYATMLYYTEY